MHKKFWVGLSSIEEIGSSFIEKLYNHFGNIEKAFNSNLQELKEIDGLSVKKAELFLKLRDKINLDNLFNNIEERGIKVLTLECSDYPELLKEISNPPAVLYIKGDLDSCNLNRTLAVVGSRRASSSGKDSLKKIMKTFSGTDICIVSGLAAGIDAEAHKNAIENNLKTIGVIASGFDYIYPESNKALYNDIINGNGAIITENYLTFEPLKFRFPQRNRIVTGLSYGTLVAEAALKSGALISANLTLDQGRELMCIPGLISNPNTEGIYKLIKNGATMITSAEDILETLNWEITTAFKNDFCLNNLSEIEFKIYKTLELEPKKFDNIIAETSISTDELLTNLTMLELKGIIKQVGGDKYSKV